MSTLARGNMLNLLPQLLKETEKNIKKSCLEIRPKEKYAQIYQI